MKKSKCLELEMDFWVFFPLFLSPLGSPNLSSRSLFDSTSLNSVILCLFVPFQFNSNSSIIVLDPLLFSRLAFFSILSLVLDSSILYFPPLTFLSLLVSSAKHVLRHFPLFSSLSTTLGSLPFTACLVSLASETQSSSCY